MTVFERLEHAAKMAHSYELQRELRNLAVEGSLILRDFGDKLNDQAMKDLNSWWVRAYQLLYKCEKSPGFVA